MNKEMIDFLPKLLIRLSDGEGLHIPTLSRDLSIPESTIQDQIKRYLQPIEIAEITHDFSTRNWTAKRNFLSETLLSANELVTIQILEVASNRYGDNFVHLSKRFLQRFKIRTSLKILKKVRREKLTREERIYVTLIENAISDKLTLKCTYKNKDRVFYPLKIALLEGYWYLFLWDAKDDIMKTFYFKDIQDLELEGSKFESSGTNIVSKLDGAINAFFKDKDTIDIELQVHKKVSIYFKRLPLSKSQRFAPCLDPEYEKMYITVTNEMEIIPIIQQYLPHIRVISPDPLREMIEDNIKTYVQETFIEIK